MASVAQAVDIERIGTDEFRAPVVPSRIKRTFGGQIMAQALRAAQLTVEGKLAHSLHCYFVGPGDSSAPTTIQVERVRDGRSFVHRHVRVFQEDRLIFMLSAGFHVSGDSGPEHQAAMPQVPTPESIKGSPYSTRIILKEWEDWDVRLVPDADRDAVAAETTGAGFRNIWFRNTGELLATTPEQSLHQAALLYMSDMTLIRTALLPHQGEKIQLASLDHSLWFLRPVRVDEWMLYSQSSPSAQTGTGLAQGKIFNQRGELLAVAVQEGLTRTLHPDSEVSSANGNWQNL
ncbi:MULTISPECIES: acyl-CoA thioesterase [Corynebacterium]|uniref:acyl-CoA thioesterase n=1 Tax=Corynebacterium TaxID=1716 RepID=UPI0008A65A7B|nr:MULTISPECIES: acyl-CoA thioesterase II [unclassified Corynebacterium]MDK6812852.1 acyl-CoA thioesterase II [Corynebacterium sp. UMB6689]OFL24801.1 acyl-CoA thioesterase II [Corynebacterium sp. HMSC062A03]OFS37644.1 acyl-CoA thioesterase II [Corynebacterium sp. HMSC069E04]